MSRQAAAKDDGKTAVRILDAASLLMSDRGYDGTSVQSIADLAGVNKALLFYYFGNKAALFERVLEHQLGGLYRSLEIAVTALPRRPSMSDAFHAVLDGYIDYLEHNPAYARLVQLELAHTGGRHDLIGAYNRKNFELLVASMGDVSDLPPEQSVEQLFITFGGMVLHYFVSAPVLTPVLARKSPLSRAALAVRRAHIHWMADAALSGLTRSGR